MILRHQLELGIDSNRNRRHGRGRRRGLPRARWWFALMHRAVDEAAAGPAGAAPKPTQTLLGLPAHN